MTTFKAYVTIQVRERGVNTEYPIPSYARAPDYICDYTDLYMRTHDCDIETAMANIRIVTRFAKVDDGGSDATLQ